TLQRRTKWPTYILSMGHQTPQPPHSLSPLAPPLTQYSSLSCAESQQEPQHDTQAQTAGTHTRQTQKSPSTSASVHHSAEKAQNQGKRKQTSPFNRRLAKKTRHHLQSLTALQSGGSGLRRLSK
ncbi:Hypothetical predicted protein, partial [Marmota monax]